MMVLAAERAFDIPETSPFIQETRTAIHKPEKRQITRNRTSYSCRTCRRRKIKCDKQHPACSNCLKTDEQCVYGNVETDVYNDGDNAISGTTAGTKRRWTPISTGTHSPPALRRPAKDLDSSNLDVLDRQLQRLTSLINLMRRDPGTAVDPPGPLTPNSGEDGWEASRMVEKSTDQPDATSTDDHPFLTQPLSELNITGEDDPILNEAGFSFWKSVVGEVDQLHAMMRVMRPMGLLPHANLSNATCPVYSVSSSTQDQAPEQKSDSDPLSFHGMAASTETHSSSLECKLCSQISSDMSMLLPGNHSAKLAASLKLDLTDNTPTEAQSNVLFRAWLTSVYTALPFMSFRQAFKKYQAFWDWRRSRERTPDIDTESADVYFMPILNCIWYAGTLSLSAKGFETWFPGKPRAQLAALYHDQVIRYLMLVSFPYNLQLPLLGCLVTLLAIPAAEEDPLQSSTFVNLMVKLAQTLGIHREPSLFGVIPVEAETRRRLWWQIVELDTSFASASGFSSFIKDDMADTKPVGEVHDIYIGAPDQQVHLQGLQPTNSDVDVLPEPLSSADSVTSVFHLVAKASHKMTSTIRKSLNMHLSAKAITKESLQSINRVITSAEEEVSKVIKRIPTKGLPELGFNPDENALKHWPLLECESDLGQPLTEAEFAYYYGVPDRPTMTPRLAQYHRQKLCAFNKWARINLSLMSDQMYCVTYAPFLKNTKSKVWATGRQCALHHCTSFMRKFISLVTDPALESFRWCWPGKHHPMHAAIVMLIDAYERPYSIEAPRSRALIDKLFAMADPVNGIIGGENGVSTQRPLREGGSEAWDLIRDLRNTAWRKVGLDPNVLWTEEDQIVVEVAKPLSAEQRVFQTLREDSFQPDFVSNGHGHHNVQAKQDSLPAVRYALDVTNKETTDARRSEGEHSGNFQVPFESASARDRSSRQLLRLPTQQLMPYPLSGQERAKCPGHNKNPISEQDDREAAAADAIRVADVIRRQRADGQNGFKDSSTTAAADRGQEPAIVASNHGLNPTTGHLKGDATMDGDVNATFTAEALTQTVGGISTSRMDYHDASTDASQQQNSADQSQDMSDTFDWERWDAVFGQYSGFTDLMETEDIVWEENQG